MNLQSDVRQVRGVDCCECFCRKQRGIRGMIGFNPCPLDPRHVCQVGTARCRLEPLDEAGKTGAVGEHDG